MNSPPRSWRAGCGPWVRLEGVKFYADGWLGPRTCALRQGAPAIAATAARTRRESAPPFPAASASTSR